MNKKIGIIGTGNVGWHLAHMLHEVKIPLSFIGSRDKASAKELAFQSGAQSFGTLSECPSDLDFIIIAVSDSAIAEVSQQLSGSAAIVHTSGSADISEIDNPRKGVIWTLQTLKKHQSTHYKNLPFFLEFSNAEDLEFWKLVLSKQNSNVFVKTSEERRKAHLAAVVSNNFVNHLYQFSEDILRSIELPFSLLYPIIEEESSKVQKYSPRQIQTGPASRGDFKTIQAHLQLLADQPEYSQLYALISQLIQQKNDAQL